MTPRVLDVCAGIGGWTVALRERGLVDLAVENNAHARHALLENGAALYHDDVTTLLDDRARLAWLRTSIAGVVGSTPCQPFSQANLNARGVVDPRGNLTLEWLAIVLKIRSPFVCLENVPRGTEDLFALIVDQLSRAGYRAEHRVVNAADYGNAQARRRRILVGRLDGAPVAWPTMTHRDPRRIVRAGDPRQPWRTLADLLPDRDDLPAWAHAGPSTTIVGSFRPECVAPPTYRRPGDGPRQSQPDVVVTSIEERLRIQGFPAGWRTAGPATAQGLQVGNAIPPTLARVALAAALDTPA